MGTADGKEYPMARQPALSNSSGTPATRRVVVRERATGTFRERAGARAGAGRDLLVAWSIPLIVTALVFAAVVVWFWWSS
jgi:hypothetical protein